MILDESVVPGFHKPHQVAGRRNRHIGDIAHVSEQPTLDGCQKRDRHGDIAVWDGRRHKADDRHGSHLNPHGPEQ
jgi:hypothetical protein